MGTAASKSKAKAESPAPADARDSSATNPAASHTESSDTPDTPSNNTSNNTSDAAPADASADASAESVPQSEPVQSHDQFSSPLLQGPSHVPPPSQSEPNIPLTSAERYETPGIKQVEVIRVNNPEDYEDGTNQTGLSHYEIKVQDSFYSVPNRPRGKAYNAAVEADRERRNVRAQRKAEKAQRRKSKKAPPPQPVTEPHTVAWAIETAKKLGVLNLCKMDLAEMPDEVFDAIPGTARIINIAFNRFTYLDNRVCDFVLVQRLIANGNLLSSIPETISRMTALKKLDLAHNQLTALPDAFEGMRHLEHVDLSDNQISALPPSFATLNLGALSLRRNKFTVAPAEITGMEWLADLDLSHNEISILPDGYMGLAQLFTLNLDNNRISDFPEAILQNCNELVNLRMRANPITAAILEEKPAYAQFLERRRIKFKRQIEAGTIVEADLTPTDS